MSDYLKDKYIPFLTIKEADLDSINSDIADILANAKSSDSTLYIEYTIRYDGIGVILKNYPEIKKCFGIAKKVERIIINLKNDRSYPLLLKGKDIEIRLDSLNRNNCSLRVADDDEAWVEQQFKKLSSRLDKCKNKNSLAHSVVTTLAIQLLGVLSGLFLSLISAKLLTSQVQIQHSFFIFFIGMFLVFLNLWTYILYGINSLRVKLWPFISFNKKPPGLILQGVIALAINAVVLLLAKWSYIILKSAGEIIKK